MTDGSDLGPLVRAAWAGPEPHERLLRRHWLPGLQRLRTELTGFPVRPGLPTGRLDEARWCQMAAERSCQAPPSEPALRPRAHRRRLPRPSSQPRPSLPGAPRPARPAPNKACPCCRPAVRSCQLSLSQGSCASGLRSPIHTLPLNSFASEEECVGFSFSSL